MIDWLEGWARKVVRCQDVPWSKRVGWRAWIYARKGRQGLDVPPTEGWTPDGVSRTFGSLAVFEVGPDADSDGPCWL